MIILSVAMLCLLLPAFIGGEKNLSPEGYDLVWSDEFEKDGSPSPENWTFEKGFVRNRELQWYQPENVFCQDGRLIIEARRERKENRSYKSGSENWRENRPFAEYTSSCLLTRNLHSWKYGRFEVRARIRARAGLWPAIWFLGVEGEWPATARSTSWSTIKVIFSRTPAGARKSVGWQSGIPARNRSSRLAIRDGTAIFTSGEWIGTPTTYIFMSMTSSSIPSIWRRR